jgi:hypothetical protein
MIMAQGYGKGVQRFMAIDKKASATDSIALGDRRLAL